MNRNECFCGWMEFPKNAKIDFPEGAMITIDGQVKIKPPDGKEEVLKGSRTYELKPGRIMEFQSGGKYQLIMGSSLAATALASVGTIHPSTVMTHRYCDQVTLHKGTRVHFRNRVQIHVDWGVIVVAPSTRMTMREDLTFHISDEEVKIHYDGGAEETAMSEVGMGEGHVLSSVDIERITNQLAKRLKESI